RHTRFSRDWSSDVCSSDLEAELIYRGVKSALNLGLRNSLVMDIGGGSVEFILCNHNDIFWKGSFEIGAQRLVDQFHTEEPINAKIGRASCRERMEISGVEG